MKIEGQIPELSDIEIKDKITNYQTGETVKVGLFRFLLNSPSQIIDVHVSADLVKDNKSVEFLKSSVGTRVPLSIEYKEMSFANSDGKHVRINGFHLFETPVIRKA